MLKAARRWLRRRKLRRSGAEVVKWRGFSAEELEQSLVMGLIEDPNQFLETQTFCPYPQRSAKLGSRRVLESVVEW